MLDNANPLEAAWTLTAFFGTLPAVLLLYRAVALEMKRHRLNVILLRRGEPIVNGPLEASTHKDIASSIVFLSTTGCFLVAGLVAMSSPPAVASVANPAAALPPVLIPIMFIVANIVSTFGSGYCLLQQSSLDSEIRRAANRSRRKGDPPLIDEKDGALD